ncbi:MAG: fibronectin type III domain-containing protein [Phycisphaerae bacterium]
MKFPKRKNEVVLLAEQILAGVAANTTTYPSPPFVVTDITQTLADVKAAIAQRQAKEAALQAAVEDENQKIETLVSAMKKILYFAEAHHAADPVKLSLIGWGTSDNPTSTPPDQPQELNAQELDRGVVELSWSLPRPATGGQVRFYRIERRMRQTDNSWTDWGKDKTYSTINRLIELQDQPLSIELEYRVICVNPSGESTPSNTVKVVL